MKNDHLYEKTIETKSIYKGKIIDLNLVDVELPNGEKSKREIVNHPGAVAIIALTPDEKLLLLRQFRKPLERTIIEIPAGKLEKGEDPLDAAVRELEEETGYKTNELKHITSFYTSPGFADELIHLYYTDQLLPGQTNMDDDEFLDVLEVTLDEALEFVEKEEVYDAKTVFAIQYLQLKKCLKG
ncbi:NUDIX hydrolase [Anaerobacillus sp. MEB173]|uniref:NUDIX hydrolase n=1 Tax=Anaerobacillus sp. MEB173 TaxID=3383345 RepID=UPI003F93F30B